MRSQSIMDASEESAADVRQRIERVMIVLYLWARPIRHITQRRRNDCAIATAAIVAQIPYETAAQQSPIRPGQRGLFPKEILRLLERTSGLAWRGLRFGWFGRVSRFVTRGDDIVVLCIRQPWRWWRRHCIAITDDRI